MFPVKEVGGGESLVRHPGWTLPSSSCLSGSRISHTGVWRAPVPRLGHSLAAGPGESACPGPGALGKLMVVECLELVGEGVDGLEDVYGGGRISLALGSPGKICGGWGFSQSFGATWMRRLRPWPIPAYCKQIVPGGRVWTISSQESMHGN